MSPYTFDILKCVKFFFNKSQSFKFYSWLKIELSYLPRLAH